MQSDQLVAKTLGASEGYSNSSNIALLDKKRVNEPNSAFEAELVKAKRYIYDSGVLQSFYPEVPFNSKPRHERAIHQATNLNQIMNMIDSDTSVNQSFVSAKLTES